MATPAYAISPSILPDRARMRQASDNTIAIRLALAERIAGLPMTKAVDHGPIGDWTHVDVVVSPEGRSFRKQPDPVLLCSIGTNGIVVHGLTDQSRHRVLSRGWGRLHGSNTLLFLPRDVEELDTVWSLLLSAYNQLISTAAAAVSVRPARTVRLPSFSRTSLQ